MIAARIDATLNRLHARLEARYLELAWHLAVGLLLAAVAFITSVLLTYVDTTPLGALRTLAFNCLLTVAVGLLVAVPRARRIARPLQSWMDGNRGAEDSLAAWACVRTLTFSVTRSWIVIFGIGMLAPLVAQSALQHDYTLEQTMASTMVGLAAGAWVGAACVFSLELYLRPIRRELARHLRHVESSVAHDVSFSLGVKLLLSASLISLLTGFAVALAATINGGGLGEVGRLQIVAIVATVSSTGFLILLFAGTILSPLEDLLTAIRRVQGGDLSARTDVTSDDEIGTVAAAFNEMLQTLEATSREVRASRARIVAASDAERRRVERNIHDGAQQQFSALALQLELLREQADDPKMVKGLEAAMTQLRTSLDQLRDLARGLHPSVLTTDGLAAALRQLADHSPVPVTVRTQVDRLDQVVESTAYFVASEALANVVKYANASAVWVSVDRQDGRVVVEVRDDGDGGAVAEDGSGLAGLADRVEAVGGRMTLDSPPGRGTTVRAELPASA
ncbi:MAG: HAMP domain-containing protein [Nitriliruptorales bacterium]|nr:HAMP domain-containing protein [Nitriliruptorales bacterium]